MSQLTKAPEGQSTETKIFHSPCAFNPKGVSRDTCIRTTKVLQRNLQGCCRIQCSSKARVCVACVSHRGEPSLATDYKTGLCTWHAQHGADKERPRKVVEGDGSHAESRIGVREVLHNQNDVNQIKSVVPEGPENLPPPPVKEIKKSEPTQVPVVLERAEVPAWERILERIRKSMAEAEYVKLHPNRIQPMEGQPREFFDERDLDELAKSIATIGQIQPGIVREIELSKIGADYELLDGERRWRGVNRASLPIYKAMKVKIDDEAAPFVVAAIANFNRAAHTHVEISNAIEKMHGGLGIPIEVIAGMFNITTHWAYQLHGLQKLHPRIRGLLDSRLKSSERLPITAGIEISKVDQKVQLILVDKFQRGTVSLRGLRKEAVDLSKQAGTYVRQRVADEPARKIKRVNRLAGAVLRELSDLKTLLDEDEMSRVLRSNPRSSKGALGLLKRADDLLTAVRYSIVQAVAEEK